MRIRKYIIALLITPLFWGCNDWLTIQPEASNPDYKMFETKQGFQDALTGIYMVMRDEIYNPADVMLGGQGNTYFLEFMHCLWELSGGYEGLREYDLYHHIYTNDVVMSMMNRTYLALYKIIANANLLIKGLDGADSKSILGETTYNIIRGEALAIRAFAHFDLIRIWGPIPTQVDAGKRYLPYAETISAGDYPYHTYAEYMEKLMRDLDEAEALLEQSEPALNTSIALMNSYDYAYWSHRQNRLNYYGVLGLQARVHLWHQEPAEALRYAQLVIGAADPSGESQFRLGNAADFSTWVDGTMFTEHLFGLKIAKYDDRASGGYGSTQNQIFCMFENTRARLLFDYNTSDIRYVHQLSYGMRHPMYGYMRSSRKYAGIYTGASGPMSVPLIRLAEMYLIVMECGSLAACNEAYTTFRTARSATVTPFTSDEDRTDRIMKEYCREFLGEGQVFFHYKRLAIENMWFGAEPCGEAQYVLPLPKNETEY